jgi:hypothetical protein
MTWAVKRRRAFPTMYMPLANFYMQLIMRTVRYVCQTVHLHPCLIETILEENLLPRTRVFSLLVPFLVHLISTWHRMMMHHTFVFFLNWWPDAAYIRVPATLTCWPFLCKLEPSKNMHGSSWEHIAWEQIWKRYGRMNMKTDAVVDKWSPFILVILDDSTTS